MRNAISGRPFRRGRDLARATAKAVAALLAAAILALTLSTALVHLIEAAPPRVVKALTDAAQLSGRTP